MARHKNQIDLETDEAPETEAFPHLASLPMHTQVELAKSSNNWSSSSYSSSSDVASFNKNSVTNSSADSGFETGTENSDMLSTLSNLIQTLNLYSEPEGELLSRRPLLSPREPTQSPTQLNRDRDLDSNQLLNVMPTMRANPDKCLRQDDDGDTILHLAVLHDHLVLVLMILQSLASPALLHIKNTLSQTALHLAVLRRKPKIVRSLMIHGAVVATRDRNGNTPLHLACRDGDMACIRQLTLPLTKEETETCSYSCDHPQLPQNPNERNYRGDGCIHLAAVSGHLDIVRYLIESPCRADVNFPDGRSGRTILHNAVESRNMGLLSFLLQHRYAFGLDLDAQTYCGNTALSLALGRGYQDVAEFLILAGADTSSILAEELSADSSSDSSESDACMQSEDDFDDDDFDFYDDLCVNGKRLYITDRTF